MQRARAARTRQRRAHAWRASGRARCPTGSTSRAASACRVGERPRRRARAAFEGRARRRRRGAAGRARVDRRRVRPGRDRSRASVGRAPWRAAVHGRARRRAARGRALRRRHAALLRAGDPGGDVSARTGIELAHAVDERVQIDELAASRGSSPGRCERRTAGIEGVGRTARRGVLVCRIAYSRHTPARSRRGGRPAPTQPPLTFEALRTPGVARGLLGRVELALDEVQPAVPEARVGEVDADDLAELLRRQRAARAQQLEVGGDEAPRPPPRSGRRPRARAAARRRRRRRSPATLMKWGT